MLADDVPARRAVAATMAQAALAWLDGLDGEQRATAVGRAPQDGADDLERRRWFYTPTDHGGLTVHQQRPAQQRAAMRLVASGLSPAAYVTVATVMGLENVLDHAEGFVTRFDRERGRDPGLYYLRVFGDPGDQGAWGWRFGGHHVSLNNLVVDGELVSTTPCFLGADQATHHRCSGAPSTAPWRASRTSPATWCGRCHPCWPPARSCWPRPPRTCSRPTARS